MKYGIAFYYYDGPGLTLVVGTPLTAFTTNRGGEEENMTYVLIHVCIHNNLHSRFPISLYFFLHVLSCHALRPSICHNINFGTWFSPRCFCCFLPFYFWRLPPVAAAPHQTTSPPYHVTGKNEHKNYVYQ